MGENWSERRRREAVERLLAYGADDLLCRLAGGDQPSLARRQQRCWRPWLVWLERRWGARLLVAPGIAPLRQSDEALRRLRLALDGCGNPALASMEKLAALCGSLTLTLAAADGRLDADALLKCSFLEERWQMERWGEDAWLLARQRLIGEAIRRHMRALSS